MSGASSPRIHAVVVTFHSDEAMLSEVLGALGKQVSRIHVIDNTPAVDGVVEWVARSMPWRIDVCRVGSNIGVAAALNTGIDRAREQGATHVLLSDQDSIAAPDMVAGLMKTYDSLVSEGVKVGAVGPTFTDANTGLTFPFQAEVPGKFFYGHVRADDAHPVVEALTLITSGTLVPMEAFADVGLMEEALFIDKVDLEWCLRARAKGWKSFGTVHARMRHSLGDGYKRVWYLGWRHESVYTPSRIYYQIRNYFFLLRSPSPSTAWKIRNGWNCLGIVYSHVLFGNAKLDSLRMALRGLRDGILQRYGPLQEMNG